MAYMGGLGWLLRDVEGWFVGKKDMVSLSKNFSSDHRERESIITVRGLMVRG